MVFPDPKLGWIRVGRFDSARRRALWVRFVEAPFVCPYPAEFYGLSAPIAYIEVCAGREGDDAYSKVTCDDPTFSGILCCFLSAADHIGEGDDVIEGSDSCYEDYHAETLP